MEERETLTILLQEMGHGNASAYNEVFAQVYEELRQMAHGLRWQRSNHETMNTTALVHEAYLRLAGKEDIDWESRSHFFGVAAKAMRFLLSNHARHKLADKRGAGIRPESLDTLNAQLVFTPEIASSLLDLDQAMTQLEALDPRQAQIVELRFYAGLTIDDAAAALGISPATIKREWTMAKAWLKRAMSH
ncbi:MAG: ECF-type sigma factor [Bacteroidia bacterium]|nr:ECF-type sigma factor [Bacteroidia bacterium]